MVQRGFFFGSLFAALHLTATTLLAQPRGGIYQIQAGHYSECCGFAGNSFEYELPYERQVFIDLAIDRTRNSARMRILQADMQTVFRPAWSQTLPRFEFENGMIFPDRIEFESLFDPFPEYRTRYKYVLHYNNDALTLNGELHHPICCDIPGDYNHANVTGNLILNAPRLTVRVSQVEVCWDTVANAKYQLQYQSPTNTWIDIGSPITGTGSKACVKDDLLPGQPRRIYRVVTTQ
jgi:hypothetical protein